MNVAVKVIALFLMVSAAPVSVMAETIVYKFRTGELITDLSHPDAAVQKVLNDNRAKLLDGYGLAGGDLHGFFGEILLEIDCGQTDCRSASLDLRPLETPSDILISPVVAYSSSSTLAPNTFSKFEVSIGPSGEISNWSIRGTEYGFGGGWKLGSSSAFWKESASGNYESFQDDYCHEIGSSFDSALGLSVCENGAQIPELDFFDGFDWTFEYAPGTWEIVSDPPDVGTVPLPAASLFLLTGIGMCGWQARRRRTALTLDAT